MILPIDRQTSATWHRSVFRSVLPVMMWLVSSASGQSLGDNTLELAARQFRLQVYATFRDRRPAYDAWMSSQQRLVAAANRWGSAAAQWREAEAWLRHATWQLQRSAPQLPPSLPSWIDQQAVLVPPEVRAATWLGEPIGPARRQPPRRSNARPIPHGEPGQIEMAWRLARHRQRQPLIDAFSCSEGWRRNNRPSLAASWCYGRACRGPTRAGTDGESARTPRACRWLQPGTSLARSRCHASSCSMDEPSHRTASDRVRIVASAPRDV